MMNTQPKASGGQPYGPDPVDAYRRAATYVDRPPIATLPRPGQGGWLAEDWQVFFDERAGIAEFGSRLPSGCTSNSGLYRTANWPEKGGLVGC
jgi:hypothetical protein